MQMQAGVVSRPSPNHSQLELLLGHRHLLKPEVHHARRHGLVVRVVVVRKVRVGQGILASAGGGGKEGGREARTMDEQ